MTTIEAQRAASKRYRQSERGKAVRKAGVQRQKARRRAAEALVETPSTTIRKVAGAAGRKER